MEAGAMSQGRWQPLEAGGGQETNSSLEICVDALLLAQRDPFQTPDFQHCRIVDVFCFMVICYNSSGKLTLH